VSRRQRSSNTGSAEHALDDSRVQDILADAELLYSAVRTRGGPHLTPTAVSWEADRLWAVAPKDSVKARALRRDPRIGLLVSIDGHHLVGTGVVRLLDPLEVPPSGGLGELLRVPFGAARYLAENSRHALNVVLDDPNPFALVDRVVLDISLRRVALVHRERVVDAWGDWPATPLLSPAGDLDQAVGTEAVSTEAVAAPIELPERTPAWARRLLARDGEVQVGWRSMDGPLALPAEWSADQGLARASAELMTLAGALPDGPACLTSARVGHKMSEKTGVLLRGDGRAALTDPAGTAELTRTATVRLTPSRVTHWRGKQARTIAMSGAS
jgi:hypothetical protein